MPTPIRKMRVWGCLVANRLNLLRMRRWSTCTRCQPWWFLWSWGPSAWRAFIWAARSGSRSRRGRSWKAWGPAPGSSPRGRSSSGRRRSSRSGDRRRSSLSWSWGWRRAGCRACWTQSWWWRRRSAWGRGAGSITRRASIRRRVFRARGWLRRSIRSRGRAWHLRAMGRRPRED